MFGSADFLGSWRVWGAREACWNHFHLSWYLSDSMVPSSGQKKTIGSLTRARFSLFNGLIEINKIVVCPFQSSCSVFKALMTSKCIEGAGGLEQLRETCRIHFHHPWGSGFFLCPSRSSIFSALPGPGLPSSHFFCMLQHFLPPQVSVGFFLCSFPVGCSFPKIDMPY